MDNNGTASMPRTIITNMYDIQGRRTSQTTSVAGVTQATDTYSHDALGRLVSQTQTGTGAGGQAKGVKYAYRADGSYATITRYSDATFTTLAGSSVYGYDDAGNLTSLVHKDGLGTSIATYSWTYDASGRITNFTSPAGGSKDYTYDANDQVKTATGEAAYSYDNAGNRTMSGYVTGDDNRLTDDGVYTYQYDDEGNRTRRTSKSDSSYVTYAYDQRNRLTEVTFYTSGGTKTKAIRYVYDANDQRIRRELDATGDGTYEVIEKYTYNGDDTELVLDGNNNLVQRFMQGSGIDQALTEERIATGEVYWLLADHQGSIRDAVTINPTTHMVQSQWSGDFDTFGNLGLSTLNDAPRFTYTGRKLDGEAGLYYYRARWYDQRNGRFLSQDPKGFGAGDANLYRYVGNNAINMTDPDGMMAKALGGRSGLSGISLTDYSTYGTGYSSGFGSSGPVSVGALFDNPNERRMSALTSLYYDVEAAIQTTNMYSSAQWSAIHRAEQYTSKINSGWISDPSVATKIVTTLNTEMDSVGLSRTTRMGILGGAADVAVQANMAYAAENRWYTTSERWAGGASITANKLTFGLTDALSMTASEKYHGSTFAGTHIISGATRELAITTASMGLGAAVQAGRAGYLVTNAYRGMQAYEGYQAISGIHAGVASLQSGNYGTAVMQLGSSALGVKGAIASASLSSFGANVKFASVSERLGKYEIGAYQTLKQGAQAGLDAHHVGQKALMRQFIDTYDPATAPSILLPKVGHTIAGAQGVVSRSMTGFTSARQVVARDIRELRRIYPDVPNSTLKRLIQMNKDMYSQVRK